MKKLLLILSLMIVGAFGVNAAPASAGSCSTAASSAVYFTNYQRWGFQADLYCTTYPAPDRIDKVQFDYPRQSGSVAGGAGITLGGTGQWLYTQANLFVRTFPGSLTVNPDANGLGALWYLAGPNINPCFIGYYQTTFFGYRIHQFNTNSWGPWHQDNPASGGTSQCGSYTF